MPLTLDKYRAFVKRYFVKWKPEYEPFVETRIRVMLSGEYPRYAKAAAKDIPKCKLVEIADVGHIPHLEAPEQFHRVLLEFLKD